MDAQQIATTIQADTAIQNVIRHNLEAMKFMTASQVAILTPRQLADIFNATYASSPVAATYLMYVDHTGSGAPSGAAGKSAFLDSVGGFFTSVFTGGGQIVEGIGSNAQANAANSQAMANYNQAIADQVANGTAPTATTKKGFPWWGWLIIVLGVIGLIVGAYFLFRK